MLFIWFGLTLIIPFLGGQYLIAKENLGSLASLYLGVTMAYLAIYSLGVYILFILFFKDTLAFFRESLKGFKGKDEEEGTFAGLGN